MNMQSKNIYKLMIFFDFYIQNYFRKKKYW